MGERLPCKQEVTSLESRIRHSDLLRSVLDRRQCTLKTAYKNTKKYQDIRGNVNTLLRKKLKRTIDQHMSR